MKELFPAVEAAIVDMRRADMSNSGANSEDVVPLFLIYLRAKISEVESWPGHWGEDIELLESMIEEIEQVNPTHFIAGKPA